MTRSAVRCGLLAAVITACACSGDDGAKDATADAGASAAASGGTGGQVASGTGGSGGTHVAGSGGIGAGSMQPGTGGSGGRTAVDAGPRDAGAHDAGLDAGAATIDAGWSTADSGSDGDGDISVGPDYQKSPDLTDKGAPKGKSFNFQMESADSEIFKGDDATLLPDQRHAFSRRIDVYVPAQYEDTAPAPILIIQDGPGQLGLIANALDNLTIETDPTRKLPAFVAIAVQNGGSDSKGSERGLEYDTMSDRYARFIQTEVLPAVLANAAIKAAYPKLAFTDNPWGRATLGCSSGGAAALTMGWFRPEWFRRIITYSGTFVDQQDDDAAEEAQFPLGAWEYHSGMQLIANSAQKPLRIFLNNSDHDNGWDADESGHHNWVIANQRTAAALKAKDYHYRWVTGTNAGHCDGKVMDQTLADTLLWAWRGYVSD
jgi:enterochelin esterase family protein